jgi:hypothetical protein
VLVLSDLHLRTTGREFPVDRLPVEYHDLVLSLGDVIDDNRDHAPSKEAGDAYERRGRAFFEALAERGRPVLAVPGNHDPVDCTRRLTEGLDDASLLHRTAIDVAELPTVDTGRERPNLSIVGHGCEQFDVQSTFLAPGYPDVPGATDEDGSSRAERVAACIERAAGRYLTGAATGSKRPNPSASTTPRPYCRHSSDSNDATIASSRAFARRRGRPSSRHT